MSSKGVLLALYYSAYTWMVCW